MGSGGSENTGWWKRVKYWMLPNIATDLKLKLSP
jgi:hypothetical protein